MSKKIPTTTRQNINTAMANTNLNNASIILRITNLLRIYKFYVQYQIWSRSRLVLAKLYNIWLKLAVKYPGTIA